VDPLDAVLKANDLVAVLGRQIAVRVIDISSAGCLLESVNRLDPGATGSLRVVYEGSEYADDVRIMRCGSNEGSSGLYFLGAEFLWTSSPRDRSLRRILPSLQPGAVKSARFETPRM
jgi:hypothetical protein